MYVPKGTHYECSTFNCDCTDLTSRNTFSTEPQAPRTDFHWTLSAGLTVLSSDGVTRPAQHCDV